MSSVKFNFQRMKTASLRKMALGPGSGFGGFSGGGGFGSGGSGSGGGSSGAGGFFGMGGGGMGRNTQNRYNPVYDDLSEGSIIEQFMPVDP